MSMTLNLSTGLRIRDPENMLRYKFQEWPWIKYDGDKPQDFNRIYLPGDIDRAYQLGVRTSRNIFEKAVKKNYDKLNKYLRQIPQNVKLEDCDLETLRQPILMLLGLLVNCKGIKIATATKFLYPFRPSLLPVIDSFLSDYYWYATSILDESIFRRLEKTYATSLAHYIFEIMLLLQRDINSVRSELDSLLKTFSDFDFGRASKIRILESLIWSYYSRAGYHFENNK